MKSGRPYYYVREIARVDGKPKVINQVYLGSPERILEMAMEGSVQAPNRIQAQEFGAIWLASEIEKNIDLAGLIDGRIPREKGEAGPSVGEYFLYAVYNRMIDACSKRAMPDWYKGTAIHHIRPVQVDELTSQMFWQKWHRVGQEDIEWIAAEFLRRIAAMEPPSSDCFMFDTTNYYTFMASRNPSELARRGKNKEGRDWLRQVGVALLVSRDQRLPLYYREYEGNQHDSTVFGQVIEDVFSALRHAVGDRAAMTVVFDKGMNAEDNIAAIDVRENLHFITTYSTHYCDDLIHVSLDKFMPVKTKKNRKLDEKGRHLDRLMAWRTTGEYWGRQRTVIVTYNPLTASKQRYNLEKKLLGIQEMLFAFQEKVHRQNPQWRSKASVLKRYEDACLDLHLPADLYAVELSEFDGRLHMNFRKNHYRIGRYVDRFGKNILITDITDWTTDEIVQASLDRWMVEDGFRQSKDDDLVAMMPIRHWTDSKIRCHIFTCIAALALLRLIEMRLLQAGMKITAKTAMREMHRLHSCLTWFPGKKKAQRLIEEPDKTQALILRAFGRKIANGVLQEI